jgi:hypothetical protein
MMKNRLVFQVNRAQHINIIWFTSHLLINNNMTTTSPPDIRHNQSSSHQLLALLNNSYYPYLLFPLGILLSLCYLKAYANNNKQTKTTTTGIPLQIIITMAISNILSMSLYLLNYITLDQNRPDNINNSTTILITSSLTTLSKYTCKMHAYLFHLFSAYLTWLFLFYLAHIKLNLRNVHTTSRQPRAKLFGLVFILLACLYTIDIMYVEQTSIKVMSSSSSSSSTSYWLNVCLIKDHNVLVSRDLIDFFMCFLIPIVWIFIKVYLITRELKISANTRDKPESSKLVLRKLIIKFRLLSIIILLLNCPVFLATFLSNYLLFIELDSSFEFLASSSITSNFTNTTCWKLVVVIFSVSILIHQLRYTLIFLFFYNFDKNVQHSMVYQLSLNNRIHLSRMRRLNRPPRLSEIVEE